MDIRQKIGKAFETAKCFERPNVLYLGATDALDLRLATDALDNLSHYCDMRVVQVRLDSWLQVAYVEGVK